MFLTLLGYIGKGFLVLIGIFIITALGMWYHDHLCDGEEEGVSKMTIFTIDVIKTIGILILLGILAFLGWLVS